LNKSIFHKISPYPSFPKRGSEGFWADPRQARTRARMTFSGQKPMSLRLSKGHKNRPLYIPPYQGGKEGGYFRYKYYALPFLFEFVSNVHFLFGGFAEEKAMSALLGLKHE